MKVHNIVLRKQPNDDFDISVPESEAKIVIDTYGQGGDFMVSTNVFELLKKSRLVPDTNVRDLVHLAIGVYAADQLVARNMHGFQGWSRHFKVYLPVSSLKEWENCSTILAELLSFLSGDKWQFQIREDIPTAPVPELPLKPNPDNIQIATLFSGGLDSLIGTLDQLELGASVALISHYKRGSEGKVQTALLERLKTHYKKSTISSFQFYVQPNQKSEETSKERSSRARSFLFLCLGVTVANALGREIELLLPENGLISLNVPLTGTRLSSHSTRTTHPYFIQKLQELLSELAVANRVRNPYQFYTKGEMMKSCSNVRLLSKLAPETLSCSHPEISRMKKRPPGLHCGYCVPCIIRRASENHSGISGTTYVEDLDSSKLEGTQSGSDLRAFKLALSRLKGKSDRSLAFEILASGPLRFSDISDLAAFIGVYKRGMEEVRALIYGGNEAT